MQCSRAQIIDDAINLAKSGHLDYQTALSVTGYLSKEVEYVPWVSALNGLSYINTMLKRTAAYGEWKKSVFSFTTSNEQNIVISGTCFVWWIPSTGSLASPADLMTPISTFYCGRKRLVTPRQSECLTWDLSFPGELGLLHGKYRLPGERKGQVQRLDGNGSA